MTNRPSFFSYNVVASTADANNFICLFGHSQRNGTESNRDITIDYSFFIVRHRCTIRTNERLTDSSVSFRDDGVSVATLTIGDGVTGEIDSGAIDVYVKDMSRCAVNIDTSAGGGGNLTIIAGKFVCKQGRGNVGVGSGRRYSWMTIGCQNANTSANGNRFVGINSGTSSAVETGKKLGVDFTFLIRRMRGSVSINTKDDDTIFGFRDDGADALTITVSPGVTGNIDSGIVSVEVAKGSECCFRHDTSASSTGNFGIAPQTLTAKAILSSKEDRWSWILLSSFEDATTANAAQYYAVSLDGNTGTDESVHQITIDNNLNIIRMRGAIETNSKNGNTVIALRDDGANAVSITIGAGVTGSVDSGNVNVIVAKNSKVNFMSDKAASSSGTIEQMFGVTCRAYA